MNILNLIYQYLEDNNFKKNPYELKSVTNSVASYHRKDPSFYMEFYIRKNKHVSIYSRINKKMRLKSKNTPNKVNQAFIILMEISGERFHGNIANPAIFDKIHKSVLKFHSTDPSKWSKPVEQQMKVYESRYMIAD